MDTFGVVFAVTVTLTGADVVTALALSVALAVNVCVPAGALFQAKLYGLLVSSPNFVVPLKNSTLTIVPSASVAFALIVIAVPCATELLLAGAVMETPGGVFVAGVVVTAL